MLQLSHVIENAREDSFPFPQIFLLKHVHLTQLATETYKINRPEYLQVKRQKNLTVWSGP
jgi:hypothetical protein